MIDFPPGTTVGQTFTAAGITYSWNGQGWIVSGTASPSYVLKGGDTMTGLLTLSGSPSTALQAAPKQYVDSAGTTLLGQTVRIDAAQSLTPAQQLQARQNIYAAPFDAEACNGLQVNGAMAVSQFNGGNVVAVPGSTPTYIVDGWQAATSGTGALSCQQGAAGYFAGFTNYLNATVTTAQAAMATNDSFEFMHFIEGQRIARLAWGTANAQPITIGFWSMNTPAGQYSLAVRNGAGNRAYVAPFTQNVAGTAEYKTVTIPGDTAGTWTTDNSRGLILTFCMAAGTGLTTTANTWTATGAIAAVGQVNAVAATTGRMNITGVVVLPGSDAPSAARSPFIMRPYETDLQACQRLYCKSFNIGTVPAGAVDAPRYAGFCWATTALDTQRIWFPSRMRAVPTIAFFTPNVGTPSAGNWAAFSSAAAYINSTQTTTNNVTDNGFNATLTFTGLTVGQGLITYGNWTADARL